MSYGYIHDAPHMSFSVLQSPSVMSAVAIDGFLDYAIPAANVGPKFDWGDDFSREEHKHTENRCEGHSKGGFSLFFSLYWSCLVEIRAVRPVVVTGGANLAVRG